MGCFGWRKKQRLPEPRRIERFEKPRQLEVVPERRQTIRATTEFKWPPRIGDGPASSVTTLATLHPQMQPVPEKEVFVSTPTSFRSPASPSPTLPLHREYQNGEHDHSGYHTSPETFNCRQCQQERHEYHQRLHQKKKLEYARGSEQEPAELPPNDLSDLSSLPQELPAATPPLVFRHELEGTFTPTMPSPTPIPAPLSKTIPRSRFSYQI